ncbi:MAG: hypothetical protein ACYC21_05155 [Eubacteriales bacterium]
MPIFPIKHANTKHILTLNTLAGFSDKIYSGFKGIVVNVKRDFPTRPVVRLLYDKKGKQITGDHTVDLLKELTVFVTEVIRE